MAGLIERSPARDLVRRAASVHPAAVPQADRHHQSPPAAKRLATPSAASPGPLDGVLGQHTTPPPAHSRLRRLAVPLPLMLGAVFYAVIDLWAFAAGFLVLAMSLLWGAWRSQTPACTEVTTAGLTITSGRSSRHLLWSDIREFYLRAAWSSFATVRTASGSTLALPGVSDEMATQLERARAGLAATSASSSGSDR